MSTARTLDETPLPAEFGYCMKCRANRRFRDGGTVIRRAAGTNPYGTLHTVGQCIVCGTHLDRIGTGKSGYHRANPAPTPDAPAHDRPDLLTRTHGPRFVQAGCIRCHGALLSDSWGSLRCVCCGWEQPE